MIKVIITKKIKKCENVKMQNKSFKIKFVVSKFKLYVLKATLSYN